MKEIITIKHSKTNQKIKLYSAILFFALWVISWLWAWEQTGIWNVIGIIILFRFIYCKARAIKIHSDKIEYWSFFYRKTIYDFKEIKLVPTSIYSLSKLEIIGRNNKTLVAIGFPERTKETEEAIVQLNKAPFTSDKKPDIIRHNGNIITAIVVICTWLVIFGKMTQYYK